MAKQEKPTWSSFTKAELIRTIKKLDARQTKLMNLVTDRDRKIAKLETQATLDRQSFAHVSAAVPTEYTFGVAVEHSATLSNQLEAERNAVKRMLPPVASADAEKAEQEERRRVFGPFPWEQT